MLSWVYIHELVYALSVFQISGQGVFVGSGGGMALPRGMHQPGVHPGNPTQGLRAQVPHQFLSAQVCCHLFSKRLSSSNAKPLLFGVDSIVSNLQ